MKMSESLKKDDSLIFSMFNLSLFAYAHKGVR